jgi:hypothetical protein
VLVDLCDHQAGGREARAEVDHAKADQVRMARDVAAMFDELRAMADRHAELHADRARLQAELERERVELVKARRPWRRAGEPAFAGRSARASDHSGIFYQLLGIVAERTHAGAPAEGARTVGMSDHTADELEDRKAFLRRLISRGHLDKAALSVTRQVIDRGEASLSLKQKFVFKRDVLDVFVTAECKFCGSTVPWSEMYQAYHNGGHCARCAYNLYK